MSKYKEKVVSIDSLYDMDGEKVWLESVYNSSDSCWCIVNVNESALMCENNLGEKHFHFDYPKNLEENYKIYTEKYKLIKDSLF